MEWTPEENKLFENALAELEDHSSPTFYENIAYRIPWKSVDEIKAHYQTLVDDINLIQSGNYPMPIYQNGDQEYQGDFKFIEEDGSSSQEKQKTKSDQRRKPIPWTEKEHQMFLVGLSQYGKGDWKSISRYCVLTKTPSQVASHGQKYFKRQANPNPVKKRRFSIHDINTIDPTFLTTQEIPNSNPADLQPPGILLSDLGQNYNAQSFYLANNQNPQPSTKASIVQSGQFPTAEKAFNIYPSYFLPSDKYHPWN